MPVSGLLGLVRPDLPRSPEGLRKLTSDPELEAQCTRLSALCTTLATLDLASRKRAFTQSLLGTGEPASHGNPYVQFTERFKVVRDAQRSLSRRYLPPSYLARVFPQPTQTHMSDPCELLLRGFCPTSDEWKPSANEHSLAFEARRDLVLALLNWELSQTGRIGTKPAETYHENVLRALHGQGILREKPERLRVRSLHDPRNLMRAVWVDCFNGPPPADPEGQLVTRFTWLQLTELRLPSGRTIRVALEIRRKGFLQIVGKMLAVQSGGVQNVQDRRGLRFIYATLDDAREGAAFIRGHWPFADIMSGDESYRNTTITGAPAIPYVIQALPMVSYFRSVAGHRAQVQHFPISAHLDLIYSRGPENHALYHLQKYTARPRDAPLPGLFFWLFPPEIYKIQWDAQEVLYDLVQHVLASLPS